MPETERGNHQLNRMPLLLTLFAFAACTTSSVSPSPSPSDEGGPVTTPVPTNSSPPLACMPTDQDNYIYHPYRLQVVTACLRVTGTVVRILKEADGDDHIRVELDAAFTNLLQPANVNQAGCTNGCLVVEPVCENPVTQTDAIATCAADADPLTPLPVVEQHVWMEGQYVFDLQHGGWAELHPLFRWGVQP